uniref:lysophospholipid acyltransferase family protein n=1 Tax=Agathobacter sp. TaxID=2021311 RepID=UPI004057BC5F
MNRIILMVLRNFWRVPSAWIKLCHYAKHTDEYSYEEKYSHIQYILKRAVKTGNIDLQVYGKENIPKEDGFLICGNHQGMFDILAIVASFDKPLAAVLKKELQDIPFLKQIIACTKSYPMDREDIRQSMKVIQSVAEEIKSCRNMLIFPEGTRSRNGNEMLEFHSGTFKCATKSKCKILPFALVDSYKVLDQKGSKQVAVQIHYLKPILYEEYKHMNTTELAAMVRGRIQEAMP